MKRLMEKTVFSGFVIAWRLATWPTSRSPLLVNATTEGVVRPPSSFGITFGSPPSITATHEFVVPKAIPIIFAIPHPHSGLAAHQHFRLLKNLTLSHLLSSILMYSTPLWIQKPYPF